MLSALPRRSSMDPGERGQRLDLDAPLISARRAPAVPGLPFYKSEVSSGPVRNPGAVPFVWEQRPGRPKPGASVRTRRPLKLARPPARSLPAEPDSDPTGSLESADGGGDKDVEAVVESCVDMPVVPDEVSSPPARMTSEEDKEEEVFVDAVETLSRTDSFAMACSVSGTEAAQKGTAASEDIDARDFMIGRFLPAAQAVAVSSPQYTFRKASTAAAVRQAPTASPHRVPERLPQQHLPPGYAAMRSSAFLAGNVDCNEEGEYDCDGADHIEDEELDSEHLMPKGCGLLPKLCMKGSIFLMNPVLTMKQRNGVEAPNWAHGQHDSQRLARSSRNRPPGCEPNQNSWEAVYRHKMGQKYGTREDDDRSKLTSNSNQLTYWGDSQTADGSSPSHGSTAAGGSFYHSRDESGGKFGASDSGWKDTKNGYRRSSDLSSHKEPSYHKNHALVKTGDSFPVCLLDDPDEKQDNVVLSSMTRETASSSEYCSNFAEDSQRIDSGNFSGCQKSISVHPQCSISEGLDTRTFDNGENDEANASRSFLPLPLPQPKTPSESWLSRTLPSVSKKVAVPSFGMQSRLRKQVSWSLDDPKKESRNKQPKSSKAPFAEALEKPAALVTET